MKLALVTLALAIVAAARADVIVQGGSPVQATPIGMNVTVTRNGVSEGTRFVPYDRLTRRTTTNTGRSYTTTNNLGTSYNTINNRGTSYSTLNNYGGGGTTINQYGSGDITINRYGRGRVRVQDRR